MIDHSVSQFSIVRRDKWLLSSLTWLPILLVLMVWAILSKGIAEDLPIGVVNFDTGKMSRQLIREYDATSTMMIKAHYPSVTEAKQALIRGDIYAYAVIPANFEQDTYKQLTPQVSVFYNSQMVLVGKLINSAFLRAQGTFNAEVSTIVNLSHGNATLSSAMGEAVPIRTQVTSLFNKNSNYAQFLLSASVPAMWQIFLVAVTILILSANLRDHGLHRWLGEQPAMAIIKTLAPYTWVFALQGIAFLIWFYLGFEWPMNGSFFVVIFAQWATIVACMIMGCFFFFLTLDVTRALSFAGAFTAPGFAFMGVTFPVTDMSSLAQAWRSLLPICHYIEVQMSQVSYGQVWTKSMMHLLPMLGYVVPALLVILLARKHISALTLSQKCEDAQ